MSLFLGNLSGNIRQDELGHVFRRFGRCNLRLKDGFGFVIYDVAANAEKALHVLRGRTICGEQISLSWSNKQPRYLKRFARANRFTKPYHMRNIKGETKDDGRRRGSQDQRGFIMDSKQSRNFYEELEKVDIPDAEAENGPEDHQAGEGSHSLNSRMVCDIDTQPLENDRWGAPVSDSFNGFPIEHYEPYHGYDGEKENDNKRKPSSSGSPGLGSSPGQAKEQHAGDVSWKHLDDMKYNQICYNCGVADHVMHRCPGKDTTGRGKYGKYNHSRDYQMGPSTIDNHGPGWQRAASWRRPDGDWNLLSSRKQSTDRREVSSEPLEREGKRSKGLLESSENQQTYGKEGSRGQKRRSEHDLKKKQHKKKQRRSGSLQRHSDWSISPSSYSTSPSRSHSVSSKSLASDSSHSRSRSISSKSFSLSSRSRSASFSSHTRSSRSVPRGRSASPRSLSLTVSLVEQLQSSSNQVRRDGADDSSKNLLNHVVEPSPTNESDACRQLEVCERQDDIEPVGSIAISKDEKISYYFNTEDGKHLEHDGQGYTDGIYLNSTVDKDSNVFPLTNDASTKNNLPLEEYKGKADQNSVEHMAIPSDREADINLSVVDCAEQNLHVPVRCAVRDSASISLEEMHLIFGHYGFQMPEENETCLPVETCFGAARLWPWEVIYYRRLKKGPISVENYARRMAQNREFGIVDKYIRSSSGWGEP